MGGHKKNWQSLPNLSDLDHRRLSEINIFIHMQVRFIIKANYKN